MNLISKRIGINDHYPIDRYSKAMFPDNKVDEDIIKNKTETADANYGPCMKNIYRSDEWIKEWIKHPWNKSLGKENAYYVYNISYSGISKPVKKYIEDKDDTVLYERANGVMYYDFDNIGKENNPPEPQEQAEILPARITENGDDRSNRVLRKKLEPA